MTQHRLFHLIELGAAGQLSADDQLELVAHVRELNHGHQEAKRLLAAVITMYGDRRPNEGKPNPVIYVPKAVLAHVGLMQSVEIKCEHRAQSFGISLPTDDLGWARPTDGRQDQIAEVALK